MIVYNQIKKNSLAGILQVVLLRHWFRKQVLTTPGCSSRKEHPNKRKERIHLIKERIKIEIRKKEIAGRYFSRRFNTST